MKQLLLFTFFCCTALLLQAQSISTSLISSAGGVFAHNDVSLDWTLGEPMTERFGESSQLTQGFWQGMTAVTPIYETPDLKLKFSIYPNPFAERFFLENESQQSLTLKLFDVHGRMLKSVTSGTDLIEVDLSSLPSQMVLTKVSLTDTQQHLRTYRLFKSN